MVTYKKISEVAEVSASTVSKALSGSGEIAPATAEKIRKIACELGYYKDKRELKRNYSGSFAPHIAIICPEIISVFYSSLAESLIDKITVSGGRATVLITRFGKGEAESIADSVAHDPDFDGIISLTNLMNYSTLNLPLVFMADVYLDDADMIYCDISKGISSLVDYLLSSGHTRIGFIGEMHTVYKEEIFRGCMLSRGFKVMDELIVRSYKRFFNVGREAYGVYREREVLPDAVICAYDEIAFGFMSEAERNGIKIPEDISVVGINNTPFAEVSSPPLTSLYSWREEMAHKAYDIIVSRILGSTMPYQKLSYESSVVIRESVQERKI